MDPEGARLLTSLLYAYGKPRLCINIHQYAAHRAAAGRCATHTASAV